MPTHYKGKQEETLALDAYIKLMRAADSVTARVHRHLAQSGLTHSQFAVLEALLHLGSLSQIELGKKLLRSSGNMVKVIDNLEKKGYVRRDRSAEDRRVVTISLEDKGRRVIEAVFPEHVGKIVAEMSILTRDEQQELGRMCRALGHHKR